MLHRIYKNSINCTYTDVFSMYTACSELVHSWQRLHGLNSDCRNTNDQMRNTFIHIFASQRSILQYNRENENLLNIPINITKIKSIGTVIGAKQAQNTHVLDTTAKRAKWRPRRWVESSRVHARLSRFTFGSRPSSSGRGILRSLVSVARGPGLHS